jgi:D-cysteine desulfhydrase family pyridoxal phosphate-dependent enzyme
MDPAVFAHAAPVGKLNGYPAAGVKYETREVGTLERRMTNPPEATNAHAWRRLDEAPRARLMHGPTPLEPMDRLRAALGAKPRLLVKRDDLTGLAFGGNKTRKLEFSIGAALAAGCDAVITCGGVQSNHVRQTAAAAAKFGLACHAVVNNPLPAPPPAYLTGGNRLLDDLLGAILHDVGDGPDALDVGIEAVGERLRAEGRKPFVIPLGASDETGSLGYVDCARELLAQIDSLNCRPTAVVLCTGSCGTHAGLLTGLALADSAIRVVGVSISETGPVKAGKVDDLARRLASRLGAPLAAPAVEVDGRHAGAGYGVETPEASAAIRLAATNEGLLLDPVYTGKTMAGLTALLREGHFDADAAVIFLHTGGAPALFAYAD